jgi:non-heme chloroperoxidase
MDRKSGALTFSPRRLLDVRANRDGLEGGATWDGSDGPNGQWYVDERPLVWIVVDSNGGGMPTITARDGAQIFYKDWGAGQPVVFSHGWPLNADSWDEQLMLFASNGYRAIAHDRRGHGRSTQTWTGNDMDTYADDLATLVESLDLTNVIHIGHSTGGGEVAHYIGRHGTTRVAKAVLVDAVPPGLLQTPKNPDGIPLAVFDQLRAALLADASQFWKAFSQQFYGANRPDAKVSQGVLDRFWLLCMQCGLAAAYLGSKALSETDFTEDLEKFDIPTLIIHGDDDQVVPISVGGNRSAKMIKGATYKVYKGAPHGLMATHQQQLNADLLDFARQRQAAPGRRGGDVAAAPRAARSTHE